MTLLSELGLPAIEPIPEQAFAYHQAFETSAVGLFAGMRTGLAVRTAASNHSAMFELGDLTVDWTHRSSYSGPFSLYSPGDWDESITVSTPGDEMQARLRFWSSIHEQTVIDVEEWALTSSKSLHRLTEASLWLAAICDASDVIRASFASTRTGWDVTKVINGAVDDADSKKTFHDHYVPTPDELGLLVQSADLITRAISALKAGA